MGGTQRLISYRLWNRFSRFAAQGSASSRTAPRCSNVAAATAETASLPTRGKEMERPLSGASKSRAPSASRHPKNALFLFGKSGPIPGGRGRGKTTIPGWKIRAEKWRCRPVNTSQITRLNTASDLSSDTIQRARNGGSDQQFFCTAKEPENGILRAV